MYRVVEYVLLAYVGIALVLSFLGVLYFTPPQLIGSLLTLIIGGVVTHYVWKELTGAPANIESTLISVLILFFLFDPAESWQGNLALLLTAVLTISAKYIIAWRNLHLFNPVAFGAFLASLFSLAYATWWIGSVYFFIPVLIGGLLITQKIRRFPLVLTTVIVAYVAHVVMLFLTGSFVPEELWLFVISYPIIFFATVMVTEPLSTPPGKRLHVLYGACIGLLSAIPFDFGLVYASLPLTLLIANALFYPTTLRGRFTLTLTKIEEIAHDTFVFSFSKPAGFHFNPGQYLEWTLPHSHPDGRGIRRYFTIASSPHESEVMLGVRVPAKSSTYKEYLKSRVPGDTITVTALSGDFLLPKKREDETIVCIAGGIGVTPFRSQIQSLIDTHDTRNLLLFYCNKTEADIAWKEVWKAGEEVGVRTVQVLDTPPTGWNGESGFVTPEMLGRYLENPRSAQYYISGPPPMVNGYRTMLKEMGVPECNIVRDYFPGLA